MTPQDAATVAVVLVYVVLFGLWLTFLLAYYVALAIGLSRFFAKVGVEPWIAWVPIYNYWKWLEVGGQSGALALLFLVPYANIVGSVFLCIGMHRTGIAFRKDSSFLILGIFLPIVWVFLLSGAAETYEPELIGQAGYPPPLAGYGSASYGSAGFGSAAAGH